MAYFSSLQGPSLISPYLDVIFFIPHRNFYSMQAILLSSSHYLLFSALLMCQYFHLVCILFIFLLMLVFASYKAQLEASSL